MAVQNPNFRIMLALEALKAFDRRKAAQLIREDLAVGPEEGQRWRGISTLAGQIGEIGLALEAARRYAVTTPQTLEGVLHYFSELAKYGRWELALREADRLPAETQQHPALLHFRGEVATQIGDFDAAARYYRQAIGAAPLTPQTWFALSMVKTFSADDLEFAQMVAIRPQIKNIAPAVEAQFLYALGKAYDDIGAHDQSFQAFSEGAVLRRSEENFDLAAGDAFSRQLIKDFDPNNIAALQPSACDSDRVIFVTGLPRSGTTLVEQILSSHSAVRDGGELNLLRAALIPTEDYSYRGALSYQARQSGTRDPWGELGRDYLKMIDERFGSGGRIVDKTLNHSRFMGLLLHMLPNAKVVWLRRNPEDCALSCFRTFFTAKMPWSWSLNDIASHFRSEDVLHAHWAALFPDRILTVPYEELVTDPATWTRKILTHTGLKEEAGTFEPHTQTRVVATASVIQVRQPISDSAIGKSGDYARFMEPFRKAYYEGR